MCRECVCAFSSAYVSQGGGRWRACNHHSLLWVSPQTWQQVTSVRKGHRPAVCTPSQFTELKKFYRQPGKIWLYKTDIYRLEWSSLSWRPLCLVRSLCPTLLSHYFTFFIVPLSPAARSLSSWLVCLHGPWWQWGLEAVFLNIFQPGYSLWESSDLKVLPYLSNAWRTFDIHLCVCVCVRASVYVCVFV